jgi:hypothetical protein
MMGGNGCLYCSDRSKIMAASPNKSIKIELQVWAMQPELLDGLDHLLRLGLISEEQVQQVCQTHLTCALPELLDLPTNETDFVPIVNDFVPVEAPQPERRGDRIAPDASGQAVAFESPSRLIPRALSSLMAEISVIWLLFLGVFLVVVSSAVLAASQWRNFPPLGQYGILLGYTLLFWGASIWAERSPNLQATSRMLQIATLLIIPVNFWMMDGFRLWQSPIGIGLAAIAALILSFIILRLLRTESRNLQLNYLGLSWLHWGWALPNVPLVATYLGVTGTAALLFRWQPTKAEPGQVHPGLVAIAFGGLLLIGRAWLRAGVPFSHLGLAVGISGWLLVWLAQRATHPLWGKLGAGLLLLGWLGTVTETTPWQAVAIGGLASWLLIDRLRQTWQRIDLLMLFGVGLVTWALSWRLLPAAFLETVENLVRQWSNGLGSIQPGVLWVFPYLWLVLWAARRLQRSPQPELANLVEKLALVTGIAIAPLAIWNSLLRSLYFSLAAVTLAALLSQHRQTSRTLVYLTHATSLAALLTWVNWGFPNLENIPWALIFLAIGVAEWSFCGWAQHPDWQQSSWFLGLALAALSYPLLLDEAFSALPTTNWGLFTAQANWGLLWLVVPAGLSVLSFRANFSRLRLAALLGIVAVLLAQLLTLWQVEPFLIGSAAGTVILVMISQRLPKLAVTLLTVGLGLMFATTAAYQIFKARFELLLWGAIVLILLGFLRIWATDRGTPLTQKYAVAFNRWGVTVATFNLILITGGVLLANLFVETGGVLLPNSFVNANSAEFVEPLERGALVTALGIGFLYLWRRLSNLGFYGLAWAFELLIAVQATRIEQRLTFLAMANIVMGLLVLIVGDSFAPRVRWEARHQRSHPIASNKVTVRENSFRFSSWHVIPMLYAVLGFTLAHHKFVATTGLYTAAAGLILTGVGRRQKNLKPFTLLGLVGVSAGAFELLIHWLGQFSGGSAGDGLTLLGLLAGMIALFYRLTTRWLRLWLHLRRTELYWFAHWHWAGGSAIALSALILGLSTNGLWLWVGNMAVLAGYAIWQGRRQSSWVYVGFFQASFAIQFWLEEFVAIPALTAWAGAIAAGFALVIYQLPWQRWGWFSKPWKISAMVLPAIVTVLTASATGVPSLLLVGGFYAWIAKLENQVRLSYLSVGLAVWAGLRWLDEQNLTQPLWYATLLTTTLLFVAQVEPILQPVNRKEQRHWLRCLAIGLFCLTALYQAGTDFWQGLWAIGLGIGLVLAGLGLRVRALLYVGTLTFIGKVLHQLWLFINDNSLLLWALGIALGLLLIWLAATFEARRGQAIAFVRHWVSELEAWE